MTVEPNTKVLPEGPDEVDLLVEVWRGDDPEMDVVAKTTAIRLRRAYQHLERELRRELLPLDSDIGEVDVLLALRRTPGHQLSAGALLRLCQVTSGAVSNRLARLEAKGWIRREIDSRDRRQVLVTLTEAGVARCRELVDTKTRAEQRLFGGLDRATLERLSDDLRRLLLSVEGPPVGGDGLLPLPCPDQAPEPVGSRTGRPQR